MAKRKNVETDVDVIDTEAKVRKTKIDYIPEDMIDEFNALQQALASRKAEGRRITSKKSPEQMEAEAAKLRKRLEALNIALGR